MSKNEIALGSLCSFLLWPRDGGENDRLLDQILRQSLSLSDSDVDFILGLPRIDGAIYDSSTKDSRKERLQLIASSITMSESELLGFMKKFSLLSLSSGRYDARVRVAFHEMGMLLGVSRTECCKVEMEASASLVDAIQSAEIDASKSVEHRHSRDKVKRWVKVGAAAVGGGLVIGLTGGLAAPLIGAGLAGLFGSMGIAGTAAFLTGTGGVALLTSLFGATGMGLSSFKMAYRARGISEFQFISHSDTKVLQEFIDIANENSRPNSSEGKQRWKAFKIFKRRDANESELSKEEEEVKSPDEPVKSIEEVNSPDEQSSNEETVLAEEPNSSEDVLAEETNTTETVLAEETNSTEVDSNEEPVIIDSHKPPFVTITITGWMTKRSEAVEVWQHVDELNATNVPIFGDHYSLCWETQALLDIGRVLESLILSNTVSLATTEVMKRTLLAPLMAAMVIPSTLLATLSILDNPWSVAYSRARKAGQVLADVLLRRQQGNRPVTLIGTSLGAKLIYECLLYMNRSRAKASKNERSKYLGIIENVILIGAPISPDRDQLEVMSTFVSGKIVNAYCKNDWVLGVLLRAMGRPWGIAGLAPIANDGLEKIVNVDLSDIVNGHRGYKDPEVMKLVLDRIVCEI